MTNNPEDPVAVYKGRAVVSGQFLRSPSLETRLQHKKAAGQHFNGVKVLDLVGCVLSGKHYRAIVECECPFDSVKFLTYLTHVSAGTVKSCGCSTRKMHATSATKHGDALESSEFYWLYRFWMGVQYRCYTDNPKYKLYTNRAPEEPFWSDYVSFKREWLSVRGPDSPAPGQSGDRIDNNSRYSLSNLRFANRNEQAQNTSSTLHARNPEGVSAPIAKLYKESTSKVKYTTGLSRVRRGEARLGVAFESDSLNGWEALC